MRRLLLIAASLVAVVFFGFVGLRLWQYSQLWPRPSSEVVQLTPEKRATLERLKAEEKFGPNDYPPLGYTGAATPEDRVRATAAVNRVVDAVLANANGPVKAGTVSAQIGKAMRDVDILETEDRDRTQGYLLEVWYILGFKGATSHFAYGSAFRRPPGYGEPLPPGWIAPDKPRPIGRADMNSHAAMERRR
jgi:hypothetical protein